jgi:hypothetical protein
MELVPAAPQVPAAPMADAMQMFERWATDPNASVEKIERLMALWERGEARKAEGLFNAAMATAQKAMKSVAADAYNPQTKSKYASYEALDRALRPIYTEHGFGLSFDSGDGAPDLHVRVLCYVTHGGGHSRTYKLDMPADGKGAKGGDVMTKTHATGSAMSYGQRYLLKMIFNIAVGEGDDDGNRAGRTQEGDGKPAPTGYDDWQTDMESCAAEGWPKLSQAFGKSQDDYRKRATGPDKRWWSDLKAKAEAATKGGAR